ncbi:MAG: hypothetical protein NUV59_00835 [Patescibacteria group bacterium]|nr:hypothetical protein [Patescibacteria group bacterium]
MKTHQMYLGLSVATILAVVATTLGGLSFAQTVTPLSCSVATSTVNANQAAILTASGGNGTYVWSGSNLNITNAVGTQFAVSYPNPGVYTVTVASAGLTDDCTFTVVAAASGALTCSPGSQSVTLGQNASFSATGGTGAYTWSSPDITITNPNGSGFVASYASTGLKTMTVSSGGVSDTCVVNVLASGGNSTPPATPGLPNTGGGYGM